MEATAIFDMARSMSYSDSTQFSNSTLLPFLNMRYHKIENALTTIKEDYFYDIYTADTVTNQNRYTLKSSSATVEGVKKIINTYIKWGSDDQYPTKLSLGNTDNDSRSLTELEATQPKDSGFYMIRGGETIIYPKPTIGVTGGLTQEVIVNLKDLTATSAEVDIFATGVDAHNELRQYHYILAMGLAADIFGMKGQWNEKQIKENEYELELNRMLQQISDRFTTPIEGSLLDVSYYK